VAEAVAAALSGDLVLSAVNLDLGPGASDEIRPFLPLAEHLGKIFVVFARGLPETLDVRVAGRVAGGSIKPIALGALKGALSKVTDEPVSYVNAPMLAEKRGMTVRETSLADGGDYATVLTISGVVGDVHRVIAGTVMERKGLVLLEIDGYEIEVPITDHMLLVRNDDVPGVIGRVGTVLGDAGVNIANMVVGRQKAGDAMMMALSIDGTIPQEIVDELLATPDHKAVSARHEVVGHDPDRSRDHLGLPDPGEHLEDVRQPRHEHGGQPGPPGQADHCHGRPRHLVDRYPGRIVSVDRPWGSGPQRGRGGRRGEGDPRQHGGIPQGDAGCRDEEGRQRAAALGPAPEPPWHEPRPEPRRDPPAHLGRVEGNAGRLSPG
jgi:hypothetical protein